MLMNTRNKFIAVTTAIFITGLIAGIICGVGMNGTLKKSTLPQKSTLAWNLNDIKDIDMHPNFPVALWDKNSDKFRSSPAIEELYGSWEEKKPFKISDVKSPYTLIIFESPFCSFCFAMHDYLRAIRKSFSKEELEIIIINPPALSEESAIKATAELRKYLGESNEEVKKAYITQDRYDFKHISIKPQDFSKVIAAIDITQTPLMLLIDKKLDILYMSKGYPVKDSAETRSFFRVWNALLSEIKTEPVGQGDEKP